MDLAGKRRAGGRIPMESRPFFGLGIQTPMMFYGALLSKITLGIVPLQQFAPWLLIMLVRQFNPVTMKRVICAAIVEVVMNSAAYLKSMIRCHGDVPEIEQSMDIAT